MTTTGTRVTRVEDNVMTKAKKMLDVGAQRYLKLLRDPCGADLARPLYTGTGSGYIARYRTTLSVLSGANTNFAIQVAPNALCSPNGHGVLLFQDAGVAGALGPQTAAAYFAAGASVAKFRTVACCAR